ncbi:MAG: iron-sulfur cluster assembly scaffold protein [Planctomycetes bacterium]|nr:iron-sulfur cluster assembly scaffold protein [Planctomycetota bacterium]
MLPALRELLLRGDGAGELQGPDVLVGRAEHPSCGDEVIVHVQLEAGRVRDLRWQAAACPASTAIAALAAKVLPGAETAACGALLQQEVARHGGLAAHERHAEALVLRALAAAIEGGARR